MMPTGSSSNSNSGSTAAMSLFQKYNDLQQTTDSCRASRDAALRRAESLKFQTDELQQKQREEIDATEKAERRIAEFHAKISNSGKKEISRSLDFNDVFVQEAGGEDESEQISLQERLDQVEAAHGEALQSKARAMQDSENWKAWKMEQLVLARDTSQHFRLQCQQWRFQALAMGLDHAHVLAALKANASDSESLQAILRDYDTVEECSIGDDSTGSIDDDPTTWSIPDDDDELKEAVDRYKKSKEDYVFAQNELETWKQKQEALQAKRNRRQVRSEQLQNQLQQIGKDCTDLTLQIQQFMQLTDEDVALANTYRQSIENHRRTQYQQASSSSRSTSSSQHRINSALRGHRSVDLGSTVASLIPPIAGTVPGTSSGTTNATTTTTSSVSNPYARKRKSSSEGGVVGAPAAAGAPAALGTAINSKKSMKKRDELASIVLGNNYSRGGRRRGRLGRDRQFGCSVEINDPLQDETTTHQADGESRTLDDATETAIQDILKEDGDDDDDDDEDDLLNFVAFRKRG